MVRPLVRPFPEEARRELRALVTRWQQLLVMITAEKNRMRRTTSGGRQRIEVNVKWLRAQLKELDRDQGDFLRSSPLWQEDAKLLRGVPGIGPIVTATVITRLPELGSINGKEVAALVGVAPFNRDSGTLRGKRTVWGCARTHCALPCIWLRWWLSGTTLSFATSTNASVLRGSLKRWLSPSASESCWSYSTP